MLASAPLGATTVAVDPNVASDPATLLTPPKWTDAYGNPYNVTATSGTITIQPQGLFVQDVEPGGGVLPTGTIVRITGGGFDASTTVTIDGVAISSANFVSAQEIDVSVRGSIEMTGHHLRVRSGDIQVEHYTSLPSLDQHLAAGATRTHWIAPFSESQFLAISGIDRPTGFVGAIFTPGPLPIQVQFVDINPFGGGVQPALPQMTIAPFGIAQVSTTLNLQTMEIAATDPIRTVFFETINAIGVTSGTLFPAGASNGTLPAPRIDSLPPWQWQIGTEPPSPAAVSLGSQFPIVLSGAPS